MPSQGSGTTTPSSTDYRAQWRALARRRTTALILIWGWLPFCGALFLLSRYWTHQPVTSIVLMVVWFFLGMGAIWWTGEFRCPRCRRRYAALGREQAVNITRGLFDTVCYNCKLAKFERARYRA